eukprot:4480836-Amphidinium_carterae.1
MTVFHARTRTRLQLPPSHKDDVIPVSERKLSNLANLHPRMSKLQRVRLLGAVPRERERERELTYLFCPIGY